MILNDKWIEANVAFYAHMYLAHHENHSNLNILLLFLSVSFFVSYLSLSLFFFFDRFRDGQRKTRIVCDKHGVRFLSLIKTQANLHLA